MNRIRLDYGSVKIPLDLPHDASEIRHTEPSLQTGPGKFSEMLLPALKQRLKPGASVGIVVSDKTRLCQYPEYLPALTGTLRDLGVDREGITFYIAYGTHPRQTEEESLTAYGPIYGDGLYRFIHHDSRDDPALTTLGTTRAGTEVKVRKDLLGNDLLITFGAILHHYFAGFGGGRKLLFPGLAGYESILQNHSLFLVCALRKLQDGCQSGRLDQNPLAEDLEEISGMLPARLEIHAILDSRRRVCEIHLGDDYGTFKEVCRRYDRFFRAGDSGLFDTVVASAGGYPKDINFIQSHKSIHNAASFVRDGGRLIILAECRDGIGNQAFMELYRLGGWDEIFRKMEIKYENNAGTALSMMQKSRRIGIRFVTSLDEEMVSLMGAAKTSPEEARRLAEKAEGRVAWIRNASIVYQ